MIRSLHSLKQQQVYTDAPAIVSFTMKAQDTATTTIVLDRPAGVVAGNLLVAYVSNDNQNGTLQFDNTTKPSGWTMVHSDSNVNADVAWGLYWKVATGAEPSTYTFTGAASNEMTGTSDL